LFVQVKAAISGNLVLSSLGGLGGYFIIMGWCSKTKMIVEVRYTRKKGKSSKDAYQQIHSKECSLSEVTMEQLIVMLVYYQRCVRVFPIGTYIQCKLTLWRQVGVFTRIGLAVVLAARRKLVAVGCNNS
jgi:hypothetical protein